MISDVILKKFVTLALKRLNGEWVIIGGTVLPLVNIHDRTTMDIDIASADKSNGDQTLELMEIADELGLPVESINQAGSFFLHRIPAWKTKLVLVAKSKSAHIFRPNGTLFLQLKIARLSPSDLSDCLAMIKYCKSAGETLDTKLLLKALEVEVSKEADDERATRLRALVGALQKAAK